MGTPIANSQTLIFQESVQTGNPVSESALTAIGGALNYAVSNAAQVGDLVMSALDEATFQHLRDSTWVLCDGRSAVGTAYQTLTSQTNIPDFRGNFPRGKDHGVGRDPHGDLAIGATENDAVGPHSHESNGFGSTPISGPYGSHGSSFNAFQIVTESFTSPNPITSDPVAGGFTETCVKACIINFFIKINV